MKSCYETLIIFTLLVLTSCINVKMKALPVASLATQVKYDLTLGEKYTCVLFKLTGKVKCFGEGGAWLGQGSVADLGDDETIASIPYIALSGSATQIDSAVEHVCAIINDGDVQCWGMGWSGKLGYGNTNHIGDNETVASAGIVDLGGRKATKIALMWEASCALLDDGNVRCWGEGYQLGRNNLADIGDNEAVSAGSDVDLGGAVAVNLYGNDYGVCALLDTAEVICWGSDIQGDFGILAFAGRTVGDNETVASVGPMAWANIVSFSKGEDFSCAIFLDGTTRCVGENGNGELAKGDTVDAMDTSTSSVVDFGAYAPSAISAGNGNACAILDDDKIQCWGGNYLLGYNPGQKIGDNEQLSSQTPITMPADVHQIEVNINHACAILTNNEVYCWGEDFFGEGGRSGGGYQADLLGSPSLVLE